MKNPLEGKTKDERNKIIAAGVLGVVALVALYFAFGRGTMSGSSTTATVKVSTTPRPGAPVSTTSSRPDAVLPTVDEQAFAYETTPINYVPGSFGAPDAGRNIFAFYEPPRPCRGEECPTPIPPTPKPLPPVTPAPTPDIIVAFANPQQVYAGSKGFRIEIVGERFSPEARVYFNQRELKTQFLTAGQLAAEVPTDLIAREGPAQIMVQTADGIKRSNQFIFNVQAPPRPAFQYIGMIGRARYNNDTAYFTDTGKPTPYGARLNDVVGGRFRLIDISAVEVVFEDVQLGFKHKVPITKAGTTAGSPFTPFTPDGGAFPGIPQNVPRYVQPPSNTVRRAPNPNEKKDDVDDLDDPPVKRP